MLFKDPSQHKRSVCKISLHPENSNNKMAIAYAVLEIQQMPEKMAIESYIWDKNEHSGLNHKGSVSSLHLGLQPQEPRLDSRRLLQWTRCSLGSKEKWKQASGHHDDRKVSPRSRLTHILAAREDWDGVCVLQHWRKDPLVRHQETIRDNSWIILKRWEAKRRD